MKTSIATVSLSGDLRDKLAAIAAAGFDGIEIFETDFVAFDASPREVGQMVRDHGLEISLFQPFRDFEGMPGEARARAFDRAERKFDLMGELGADLVLVCSNVAPDSLGGIDRAAADFRELGERAAPRGIRVGFEALAWGRHINDHRDAWEVVRRADHANVGLILDSFHTLARKIDPDTIRRIPADKIFFVQLADAPLIDMDLLYWSRHFRNMPGQGDLDVTGFMRAVAATGYDGVLSLEIFNDQFRGASTRSIAVDGRRSLIALADRVRRAEPASALSLPQMPDRVPVTGVEFIEFASEGAEAEALGRMLAALGFRRSGRHVSKSVDLWTQGDIHLVVNTETEGFAHASYVLHGTNVCDIGLSVEDAAATLERARALGADMFEQPLAPGQLAIPAIRGLGGSVLHFLDETSDLARVWEIEFTPLPAEGQDAGLVAVDHIAQSMRYEELLTWLLFYTTIFQTAKTPMVDVVDPAGLVRSQAIEGADGGFRVTLNGAENARTLAGHFLAESFGSAVQHIAFRTDDIFATAERLARNGFETLTISPNYYADLGARLGLEPALVDRLRAAHILYDRDAAGEYFQLYSATWGEGFFFEIVERRGGYAGYGAVNAPFRIAAQKRGMRPAGMPKA
ncbi:MAG: sugar phosphate isomerase/epimerase and 4-hydroxyphenylpyruvate domain-containing protein [Paracoccaceae bacterium]|nr:sugar phosphate isomerase/epimerase and 4-hydroxyphenylpyruvate domain-containing protein [Paracoccaceae bacterium]